MKATEFVKKFGLDNAEKFLNKSLPIQQKHFRKLKAPCGGVIDAKELMNEVVSVKIKIKINQIGINNLKEFIRVFEVDTSTFGTTIVNECYIAKLKRLVESHELVEKLGGLDDARDEYFNCVQNNEASSYIAQAIADVEACQ